MAEFRVALSGDFFKEDGSPSFAEFDLSPLRDRDDVELIAELLHEGIDHEIGDVLPPHQFLGRGNLDLEPAGSQARQIYNHMGNNGVLIGTAGPHGNVLKIRPPITFGKVHAEQLIATLDDALSAAR